MSDFLPTFSFTPGGADDPAATTPAALQYKRALLAQSLKAGSDYSPVQSPWQGAARVAEALYGGYASKKLDKQEAAGQASASKQFAEAANPIGAASAAAMPSPGSSPATTGTPAPAAAATSGGDYERPDAITPSGKMPSMAMSGMGAPGTWNLNQSYLPRLAQIESGGNPGAVNKGSGAAGLFQFVPSTWKQYAPSPDASPLDPQAATAAVSSFTQDNRAALAKALGRDPTPGELYLAHQQGAGGAAQLLANPNARAGDIVGDSAVASNGGDPNGTAGQFANKWINKFEGTSSAQLPPSVAQLGAPTPQKAFQPAPAAQLNDDAFVGSDIAKKEAADTQAPGAQPVQGFVPPAASVPQPIQPSSTNPYAAKVPAALALLKNPFATPEMKQYAINTLQKAQTYDPTEAETKQLNLQSLRYKVAHQDDPNGGSEAGPKVLPSGGIMVDKTGKVIADNRGGSTGEIDDTTVDSLAKRVVLGDTTALVGLGRGAQGGQLIARVQKRVAEITRDPELAATVKDAAEKTVLDNRNDQKAEGARARTAGGLNARMDAFASEAAQAMPLALEASRNVPRTTFVPLNKAEQFVSSNTGSPELARFVAATNTLVNAYSKAVSMGGSSTVTDREHAREMLNTAQSPEQYEAVVKQLAREVEVAHKAAKGLLQHGGSEMDIGLPPPGPGSTSVPAFGLGGAQTPAPAATPVQKTINGVIYEKRGNDWFIAGPQS